MLYLVVDLEQEDIVAEGYRLADKIDELGYTSRKLTSSTTMVSYKKTAEELVKELGIGTDNRKGIVNAVENYAGFAKKDFVSWFQIHSGIK